MESSSSSQRDRIAAIALFGCAAIVAVSIASFEWFSRGAAHIGLAGVWRCSPDRCQIDGWNRWQASPDIPAIGWLGIAALAAAVVVSAHAGVMLLRGRRVSPTFVGIALAVAACATVGFWAEAATLDHLAVGPTGFVALAGIAGAAIAVDSAVTGRAATRSGGTSA